MRIKCYSVRLKSLIPVSDKAYKATAFDGSTAIIPKSQVLGYDFSVEKSDSYWISSWILGKKSIQYSRKKEAWVESDSGKVLPTVQVENHIPVHIEKISDNTIDELRK